ncbi:MAG TPA: hypothetical protein DDZ05_00390 [Candidatus Blackburnbacteria bacterium]|nr:hypothetical protein [Candidatus Blackburnbacteria bacterium]
MVYYCIYFGIPMNYAIVTAKVDPQTKKEAQKVAKKLGIPLSVVIKAFLKQFARSKAIEFSARDEEPNKYLKSVMMKAEESYKKGKTSPAFTTADDAVKYLEDRGI